MKKFLVLALGLLCLNVAYAQNKHQKPEDYVAVKSGDLGLGFSTTFNRSDIRFQSGLFAKWFVADNWALRFNLRFGRDWAKGPNPEFLTDVESDSDFDTDISYDDRYDPEAEDLTTIRKSNFMLVFGVEHRHKLSNRFFGYYGTDLGVGAYGQKMKALNENGQVASLLKLNRSTDVTIQPFIGIECFLGPRISVAMEGGYDILFKFYSNNKLNSDTGYISEDHEFSQYNKLASHIDFGNSIFGTAKLTYYF